MNRKYIDCREIPSDTHCSIAISANTEEELMEAAAQHAVQVHGHRDTPELRSRLHQAMHIGEPTMAAG
ncbi:DUF1059 domain-containing protein [Allosphingosinicella flava]|uniref:DUF1059 domain-containing protein n=1 Tax=Allosphingosinicella flava TaxID=2771430 RepID=A0A7T2GHP9_9SPHN|nr:DUF1059 domain-containing protein [Sphingosinicella flava]QPQ54072.1 DUF1059 domain-containing protein [Sphingosinicella flava]